jgi:hypothetical protein
VWWQIPASRIKIVSVRAGSVALDVQVLPTDEAAAPVAVTEEDTNAQLAVVASLASSIQALADAPDFATNFSSQLGFPVSGLLVSVSVGNVTTNTTAPSLDSSVPDGQVLIGTPALFSATPSPSASALRARVAGGGGGVSPVVVGVIVGLASLVVGTSVALGVMVIRRRNARAMDVVKCVFVGSRASCYLPHLLPCDPPPPSPACIPRAHSP